MVLFGLKKYYFWLNHFKKFEVNFTFHFISDLKKKITKMKTFIFRINTLNWGNEHLSFFPKIISSFQSFRKRNKSFLVHSINKELFILLHLSYKEKAASRRNFFNWNSMLSYRVCKRLWAFMVKNIDTIIFWHV